MLFANREYLFLLILLVPYVLWYCLWRKKKEATLRVSSTAIYKRVPKTWRNYLLHAPMVLRCVAFTLLVIAMARPQTQNSWDNRVTEGIDIVMCLDISTSMLAEDLKPNRIEAAKNVAAEFIANRPNDNMGIVIFAGETFVQCPMTTDHATLVNMLRGVRTDITQNGLMEDGTAIGDGLATAISRLQESKAKSKVVILLTDGVNNRGDISPLTAAQIAQSLGVRVYTIGLGTNGTAPYPMIVAGGKQYVNVPVEIDAKSLNEIAATANGNYYRATNNKELKQIYEDIDKLEKSKLTVQRFSKRYDVFMPFAMGALLALLAEILLRTTILRRLP